MRNLRFLVTFLLTACGAATAPAPEHSPTSASAPVCSPPELAPSITELSAALVMEPLPVSPTITMVELDGVAPREAVVTATIDIEGEHQANVWFMQRGAGGWTRISEMSFPLGDAGTFEASLGATTLRVLPTEGCREAIFVRVEDANGGADPRELSVGVYAFALQGGDVGRAWFCRTTTLVESGPDRATVSESERTITFDDTAHAIEVVELTPTTARSTYTYSEGHWTTRGADVCARD